MEARAKVVIGLLGLLVWSAGVQAAPLDSSWNAVLVGNSEGTVSKVQASGSGLATVASMSGLGVVKDIAVMSNKNVVVAGGANGNTLYVLDSGLTTILHQRTLNEVYVSGLNHINRLAIQPGTNNIGVAGDSYGWGVAGSDTQVWSSDLATNLYFNGGSSATRAIAFGPEGSQYADKSMYTTYDFDNTRRRWNYPGFSYGASGNGTPGPVIDIRIQKNYGAGAGGGRMIVLSGPYDAAGAVTSYSELWPMDQINQFPGVGWWLGYSGWAGMDLFSDDMVVAANGRFAYMLNAANLSVAGPGAGTELVGSWGLPPLKDLVVLGNDNVAFGKSDGFVGIITKGNLLTGSTGLVASGTGYGTITAMSVVPEPTTMVLLCIGGLWLRRRK